MVIASRSPGTPVSASYQQTVGEFAAVLQAMSGNGPSEPHVIARIVRDLAGRDDAPVRLLRGPEAYAYAAGEALALSDKKWRAVTESASTAQRTTRQG
ncbi:hypothetical protein ACKI1Q_42715 [Streptomyces galilaeus]|uniref:hypothetical protein n=1 Tax=Streptomyces galilaeus TaxID=33899 RepID=UPI0038F65B9B